MTQITSNIRALPIYRAGLSAGQDIGLAVALNTLTAETARQHQLAGLRRVPGSPAAARQTYAAAILHDVSKTLARRFRTQTERTAP